MRDARRLMLYNDFSFACHCASQTFGCMRYPQLDAMFMRLCSCTVKCRVECTLALLPGEMGDRAGLCGETGDLAPTGRAACRCTSDATRPGCQISAGASRLSADEPAAAWAAGALAGKAAWRRPVAISCWGRAGLASVSADRLDPPAATSQRSLSRGVSLCCELSPCVMRGFAIVETERPIGGGTWRVSRGGGSVDGAGGKHR